MERANKSAGKLLVWQTIYLAGAAAVLPFAPLLYLQGQYTRRKIGVLPDAGGERSGITGSGGAAAKLLIIGESTIAGLGARTHELALAGQFAQRLAARIARKTSSGKPAKWQTPFISFASIAQHSRRRAK